MLYLNNVTMSKKMKSHIEQFLSGFGLQEVTVIIADVSKKADFWMADEFFQTLPYPGDDVFRAWNNHDDKSIYVFKDAAETDDSIFWVIIHECVHLEIHLFGKMLIYSGLYHETEKKIESMGLTRPGYLKRVRDDDELHETDPEEELCNRVATSLMGFDFGRKWWRKRKLEATT